MNRTLLQFAWLPVIAGMVMFSTKSALASPIIDFNIDAVHQPFLPIISYAGGGAPMLGSGIKVDTVVALDADQNSDELFTIFGGVLNFTTGGYIDDLGGNGWRFAGGGQIQILGAVDTNDDGFPDVNGTLFSGIFTDDVIVYRFASGFNVLGAGIENVVIHDGLWELFGVLSPGDIHRGGFNLSFITNAANVTPGSSFISSHVLSGDVTALPELNAMSLAGIAMACGACVGIRRRASQRHSGTTA